MRNGAPLLVVTPPTEACRSHRGYVRIIRKDGVALPYCMACDAFGPPVEIPLTEKEAR